MFFSRLNNLFKGKFTRWLKRREARDPEAVYEAAIADRVKRYQQLKTAAAGVIYMRTKLERELKDKSAELAEVDEQAGQAADLNEDECALILIRRKHELEADIARLKDDLSQLTAEADGAKRNLMAFKGEIDKLKAEKVTMVARLRNAQARSRIQRALDELPYEEDLRALAEVRESIEQALAEAGVNREVHYSEVDQKLDEIRRRNAETKAQAELAELKRRRRPPLAPLDIFANVNTNGTGEDAATHDTNAAH
ncbi:MAG TPA: PspA/IM30 family protein [Candidatus Binataceae bacterium]|nr:PspA/IM30 family protein [Candidatus Binataceae bacterium]